MQTTTLQIDGMSCGHCVGSVKKALAAVDGVTVQALGIGNATVEHDEARISAAQIADVVTASGYPATVA